MTSRIATYSRVTLRTDRFRDQGVSEGAVGYVVEVYDGGAYEVEFSDPNGVTLAQIVALEGELQVSEPHTHEPSSR